MTLSFKPTVTYAAGGTVTGLSVADINGDGIPDLVAAASNGVDVFLGSGDGSFSAVHTYSTGQAIYTLTIGDFNGDGLSDVAAAQYDGSVAVFLNNGSGGLAGPAVYPAGDQAQTITAGDLNGDGAPDLIIAESEEGAPLQILLNNGSGGFLPVTTLSEGPEPSAVTIADLNGDGLPDLIVPNDPGATGNGIYVALNDGSGNFSAPVDNNDGGAFAPAIVADVNGDGIPDIVYPDIAGEIAILYGAGDGTFPTYTYVPVPYGPVAVAYTDMNGDGIRDLVFGSGGALYGALGKANGGFGSAVSYATVPNMGAMTVEDLNGDGKPDAVIAQYDGTIDVLLNISTECFLDGTRVLTNRGEVMVQNLPIGDHIRTSAGVDRPIVWIGSRMIDCRRHPNPGAVWPIRIVVGAFGAAQPSRDLYLSPDHAVFTDGVLIPVRHLIDGMMITQEPRDFVTYFHVELDLHDVLLAEGLPCESFLNVGNRMNFANGRGHVMTLHPNFAASIWETACAPLVVHGAQLASVRANLGERAEMLGFVCGNPSDVVPVSWPERTKTYGNHR